MTDPQLSVDTLLDLLRNRRRRYLLYCLDQKVDSVVTVDELTAMLLDWEHRMNAGAEAGSPDSKRRIRIELHHSHLPKLADLGVVEFDSRSKTIRKRDAPSVVAFAEESHDEVPHLRSLLGASATS